MDHSLQLITYIAVRSPSHPQNCEFMGSAVTFCNSVGWSPPEPLSMEFSRQEYWSRLPFPTPGDFPDPGIKPTSLRPPALARGFFTNRSARETHRGLQMRLKIALKHLLYKRIQHLNLWFYGKYQNLLWLVIFPEHC